MYNNYIKFNRSMEEFEEVYKAMHVSKGSIQIEKEFRGFIKDIETIQTLEKRDWNSFTRTCRELIKMGYYSAIVKFMIGVFLYGSYYDIRKMKECLDTLDSIDGISIANLSSDYYFLLRDKENRLFGITEKIDVDAFTYKEAIKGDENPYLTTPTLGGFITYKLYDYHFGDWITTKTVDYIVCMLIESQLVQIKKDLVVDKESLWSDPVGFVNDASTDFDLLIKIPGYFLEVFRTVELKAQHDICMYILTNYVLPVFLRVPWGRVHEGNVLDDWVTIMSILFRKYAVYFQVVLYELDSKHILDMTNLSKKYDGNEFLREAHNEHLGDILSFGLTINNAYPRFGLLLADIVDKNDTLFRKLLPDDDISYIYAITSYLLLTGGHLKRTTSFISSHYSKINERYKQRLFLRLTLIKNILSTDKLEDAMLIYGYFVYELDRSILDVKYYHDTINEIINYLYSVKQVLELSGNKTITSNELWVDIVFKDTGIIEIMEISRNLNNNLKIIPQHIVNELFRYVESVSYPSGIRLNILNIEKKDNYDKLESALPKHLISHGIELKGRYQRIEAFYNSIFHRNFARLTNTKISNHIDDLMNITLMENMNFISEIRDSFFKKHEGQLSSNSENEEEESLDWLISELNSIVTDLSYKLKSPYIDREDVKREIYKMQMKFIDKYSLSDIHDLLSTLPIEIKEDCHDLIITSELVYRLLSAREDSDKLDFSAALISLTKCIEILLHEIYKRLKIIEYPDIDNDTKKNYFFNGIKKESVEFGKMIYALGDSKYTKKIINNKGTEELIFGSRYSKNFESRFKYWRGHEVIEIEKLKRFDGLEFRIHDRKYVNNTPVLEEYTSSFSQDSTNNRILLIKALEYVKDNYRNKVAHKDGVSIKSCEDAREILLQTKDLMWILIYLTKRE